MSIISGQNPVRRGIVGHSDLRLAECFPWKSDQFPNFADFKVLIVDLRTLQAGAPLKADDVLLKLRTGIYRLVKAGGVAAGTRLSD